MDAEGKVVVLHHYKLTRFSNANGNEIYGYQFYTITNLQGSQTNHGSNSGRKTFYTITNLQGSQTWQLKQLTKLCFTPLQTYKVFKLNILFHCKIEGFTPLQTYKVLKLSTLDTVALLVLHHYKLTRFSNCHFYIFIFPTVLHHYKLTRFSNVIQKCMTEPEVLHHYKLTRFSNASRLRYTTNCVLHHYKLTRFSNLK